jgi:hypothetical protein
MRNLTEEWAYYNACRYAVGDAVALKFASSDALDAPFRVRLGVVEEVITEVCEGIPLRVPVYRVHVRPEALRLPQALAYIRPHTQIPVEVTPEEETQLATYWVLWPENLHLYKGKR